MGKLTATVGQKTLAWVILGLCVLPLVVLVSSTVYYSMDNGVYWYSNENLNLLNGIGITIMWALAIAIAVVIFILISACIIWACETIKKPLRQ